MVRPGLSGRLSSMLGKGTASNPPSTTPSRSGSPKPGSRTTTGSNGLTMPDQKTAVLCLKVKVIKGRDLAAKDKNNTSDPVSIVKILADLTILMSNSS